MDERTFCAPGTRVEVSEGRAPMDARSGVVLYVGSDTNVLVGWDDESTSVLPQEALLLATLTESAAPAQATA